MWVKLHDCRIAAYNRDYPIRRGTGGRLKGEEASYLYQLERIPNKTIAIQLRCIVKIISKLIFASNLLTSQVSIINWSPLCFIGILLHNIDLCFELYCCVDRQYFVIQYLPLHQQ